jgi:hypothetical protein
MIGLIGYGDGANNGWLPLTVKMRFLKLKIFFSFLSS